MERVKTLILAESKHGLNIKRDYDVSLPEIIGDKEQLMQAVINIARNAAQALGDSGEIVLRTRIARQVTIAKVRHRHAAHISIIDDGPGVPEKIRDKIFYPLVTGREGGSGLGLSLAQRYIHHHNGNIEFTSRPGQTCFSILLPIIEAHSAKRFES
jgi:two-component system nitrogen regulation sensor histidine kinase GlnL